MYGAVYYARMTKQEALALLEVYGRAWVTKDAELITTIFTDDAVYADPSEPLATGRKGIRAYWQSKVVESQKDISFSIRDSWMEDDVFIVEWEADFVDVKRNLKIHLVEVGIFTTSGNLFSGLREYYKSTKTPL